MDDLSSGDSLPSGNSLYSGENVTAKTIGPRAENVVERPHSYRCTRTHGHRGIFLPSGDAPSEPVG